MTGSLLNTGAEISRHRFKQSPGHRDKLYTSGLFALSRHINFFGDILWVVAYAVVSDFWWSAWIPAFTFSFFAFYNVPVLDRHLKNRYGEAFDRYAARTKKLIPFILESAVELGG